LGFSVGTAGIMVNRQSFGLLALAIGAFTPSAMALDMPAQASTQAFSKYPGTAAIDAKGVFHKAADYPGKHPPWVDDQLKTIAPTYPYADRTALIQGVGKYRIVLDLQTGTVANVFVIKSAGSRSLDYAAAKALRQWRWKPGKWKAIDMAIQFVIGSPRASPGAVRLPPW
jgi:TonB family protein